LLRRDVSPPPADLGLRLELLRGRGGARGADPSAIRRVREEARDLRRQAGIRDGAIEPGDAGRVLALAYPDRVAQRRPGPAPRYLLRNGGGAALPEGDALVTSGYLVIAETDGRRPEAKIGIAAPIERAELEELFAPDIERERVVAWDSDAGVLVARVRRRLGAIVLDEAILREIDADAAAHAVLQGLRREGIAALPWGDAATRLRLRVAFLRTLDDRWPDLSDAAMLERLDEWLAPHVRDVRRRADLERIDLGRALLGLVPHDLRGRLDALAPTHIVVPTGSRIPVDYGAPAAPALSVRLQEMFGLEETPTVGGGRVPLTLHLLSPAGRPVQVTRDLRGFWRDSYFEVRRDLRGRYPKHSWPDDPAHSEPTRRARRSR
ncbi:MAG TPA: ATP-dependent helicase C-terminal domain-containing protein, partial [Gemmatimonadales bacterium]|nr:ATP-dependent helicase C-terminal domain-containing protein [Gemmatimonadales bacterium]